MKKLFVASLVLLCAVRGVSGGTFYLDAVNGSDTNPGTSSQPWKSMNKAKLSVKPGDTVLLRDGNYGGVEFKATDPNGLASQWITFQAQSGAQPTFTSLTILGEKDRYYEFKGIRVIAPDQGIATQISNIMIDASDHIKFTDLYVKGVWKPYKAQGVVWYCIYTRSNLGPETEALVVQGCEISDAGCGIKLSKGIGEGIVIKDNYIHHMASGGVNIDAKANGNPRVVIKGNHIYNQEAWINPNGDSSHGTGISLRNSNIEVRNNIIHLFGTTSAMGTYQNIFPTTGYTNMLFENNLIFDSRNMYAVKFIDIGNNFVFRNNTIVGQKRGRSGAYCLEIVLNLGLASAASTNGVSVDNNILVGGVYTGDGIIGKGNIIFSWYNGKAWQTSLPGNIIVQGNNGCSTYFEKVFFKGQIDFTQGHGKHLEDSLQLASSSPAIGYADAANAPATDLLENPRDASPDAGCYEFSTTGIVKTEYPISNAQLPMSNEKQQPGIYDMTGRYLGTVKNSLKPGLYLVKQNGVLNKVVVRPNK